MAELSIKLLGQFRLRDGAGRELVLAARKPRALIGLLALRLGQPQPRERLAALLWEDADDAAARSSLRQALTALRRALPDAAAAALDADAGSVALDPKLTEVDVSELRKAPRERVLELYDGHLLEGFDARSGGFQDLIAREREALRREARVALDHVQREALERGDDERALLALLRLTELEPVNEAAQRALMELYAKRGQFSEALNQYRRCADVLHRELGVAPEPRTEVLQRELLKRRREASPAPQVAAPPEAAPSEPALRDVAVLAARVELPEGAGAEQAAALMSRAEQAMARAVLPLGGATERAVGSCVVAAFGVQGARGDEAARAVRAALTLARDGALALGLAQGQILASAGGGAFAGPPFAAALALAAGAAPGEALASDELCRGLAPRLVAERAGNAWRVSALGSGSAAPFVGRGPELALMLSLFERCEAAGKGRALHLRAEPGLGKTRLLEAFSTELQRRGAAVHLVQALDVGQSVNERPLAQLARGLGSAQGADSLAELSPDARQRATARALAELVAAAATHSTQVLIVDDAHWTDADERAMLAQLAVLLAGQRALLVLSTRPEGDPLDAAWRAQARACPLSTVELTALADDEARELAEHYGELVASDTVTACLARAEGHPLFLDQLLRAAAAGQSSLPGTVRSLVLARLERLPSEARQLVQAAAVLGQRFPRAALAALTDTADSERALAGASEAGLLAADGAELGFGHALFRDAVYSTLLKSTQHELHRRAAEWFAERDAVLFAHHLVMAEDPRAGSAALAAARALSATSHLAHALEHAERARALGAPDAAALHAELLAQAGRAHEALEVSRESGDWFGMASALRLLDRPADALAALDRHEAELGAGASAQALARLWSLRGNLYFPMSDVDACLHAHQRALTYAQQAGARGDEARALGGLGDAYYQRGRMRTARDHFARAVAISRAAGLERLVLANLPMLGATRAYCGEIELGRADAEEARLAARRSGEARVEIVAGIVRGLLDEYDADFSAMLEVSGQSLELADKIGARRFEAEARSMVGVALLGLGETERALEELRTSARRCDDAGVASYCGATVLSALAFAASDPAERGALFARAEKLLARDCVGANYFEFYRYAIAASLREQDFDEAMRLAEQLEIFTRSEPLPWSDLLIAAARRKANSAELVRSGFRWLSLNALAGA
jgi:DNA-binding SARP family transcriptional activator